MNTFGNDLTWVTTTPPTRASVEDLHRWIIGALDRRDEAQLQKIVQDNASVIAQWSGREFPYLLSHQGHLSPTVLRLATTQGFLAPTFDSVMEVVQSLPHPNGFWKNPANGRTLAAWMKDSGFLSNITPQQASVVYFWMAHKGCFEVANTIWNALGNGIGVANAQQANTKILKNDINTFVADGAIGHAVDQAWEAKNEQAFCTMFAMLTEQSQEYVVRFFVLVENPFLPEIMPFFQRVLRNAQVATVVEKMLEKGLAFNGLNKDWNKMGLSPKTPVDSVHSFADMLAHKGPIELLPSLLASNPASVNATFENPAMVMAFCQQLLRAQPSKQWASFFGALTSQVRDKDNNTFAHYFCAAACTIYGEYVDEAAKVLYTVFPTLRNTPNKRNTTPLDILKAHAPSEKFWSKLEDAQMKKQLRALTKGTGKATAKRKL